MNEVMGKFVTVSFEVGENVYAVMERNAAKTESEIGHYLCMLALDDDKNPAFLMELLRRTEKIEFLVRRMNRVYSQLRNTNEMIRNLKENFEYEFGELGEQDYTEYDESD